MALVANNLQVKGTFGRWSTRHFTLVGSDATLLLRTFQSEDAASPGREPQSTRAISGLIDVEDREGSRQDRFDLMLVRGNGSISLAAPDADVKAAWIEAVTQVLGSSARQLRKGSIPQTDLEMGDAGDAAVAAAAALVAAEEELGDEIVEKYRAAFDAAEQDGDGVLNAAELATLASDQLLHAPDEGEIEDMVAEVDGDGDGGLDFAEFLQAMRTRRWGLAPTEPKVEAVAWRNRAGDTVECGRDGDCTSKIYCGMRKPIPGTDGQCGPSNGPQCDDCKAFTPTNSGGRPMAPGRNRGCEGKLYCGVRKPIAGTDGQCGPSNGPQCDECEVAQREAEGVAAWDQDAESTFLQMLNPSVNDCFRVYRTAECDVDDAEVVGAFRWRDLEHNRIRVTEEREVGGETWFKLHSSMCGALRAHDDYVEHDLCEEGWLVSLSHSVDATDENMRVGAVVLLVEDKAAFEAAFQNTGYVWNDSMEIICGTAQMVVEKRPGVFGLPKCDPTSTQPVWYYPFSVIAKVVSPGKIQALYRQVSLDEPAPRRAARWDPVCILSGRGYAGLPAELPSEEAEALEKNVFFIRQDDHDSQPYRLFSRDNNHYYHAHELELIDETKAGRQKLFCPCKERHEMVRSAFYKMEYEGGAGCEWCRQGIAVGQERWFCPECQADVCFKCRPPCVGVPEPHEDAPDKVEFHTMDEDGSQITFVVDADNGKLAYCVDGVLKIADAKLLDQEGPLCSQQHCLVDQGEVPTYRWHCDVSGETCTVSRGNKSEDDTRRHRCSRCDYDACANCFDASVHPCEDNTAIVVGTACGEDGQTSAKVQAQTAEDLGRVRALLRATAGAGTGGSADDADEALPSSSTPVKIGALQDVLAPECKCPLSGICAESASAILEAEVVHSHGDLQENRPEAGAVRCNCCKKRSTSEENPWLRCADCKFDLCPECSADNTTVRYARHQAAEHIQECPNESDHLKPFKTPVHGYGCDGCSKTMEAGSWAFGCHECCNFDLCASCFVNTDKRRSLLAAASEAAQQRRQRREQLEQEEEQRRQEAAESDDDEHVDLNRATVGDYCKIQYDGDGENRPKGLRWGIITRDDHDGQPYQVKALEMTAKEIAESKAPTLSKLDDPNAKWDTLRGHWFFEEGSGRSEWASKFVPFDEDDDKDVPAVSPHSGFLVAAQDADAELFKVDQDKYFDKKEDDAGDRSTSINDPKLRHTVELAYKNKSSEDPNQCEDKTVCLKAAFSYSRADFNKGEMPYFEVTFEDVVYMDKAAFTAMEDPREKEDPKDTNYVKNVPSVGIGLMKAAATREMYDEKLWDHPDADKQAKKKRAATEAKQKEDAYDKEEADRKRRLSMDGAEPTKKDEKKEKKEAAKAARKALKNELAARPCARSFAQPWTIASTKNCEKAVTVAKKAAAEDASAKGGKSGASSSSAKASVKALTVAGAKRRVGLDIQDSFGYYSDGSVKIKYDGKPEAEAYFFHRPEGGSDGMRRGWEASWDDKHATDQRNKNSFEKATFAQGQATEQELQQQQKKKQQSIKEARAACKRLGIEWTEEQEEEQFAKNGLDVPAKTVGCGLDVGLRELFFTRKNERSRQVEYIGTASYRACGKRDDSRDAALFVPVITFTGVLSAKVKIAFRVKGDDIATITEATDETVPNSDLALSKIFADSPFCSSVKFSDDTKLSVRQMENSAPVNALPFLPEYCAMMNYIALKHDKTDDGEDDVEKDLHHVIEDYVNAQVNMYNKRFEIGQEVSFTIPDGGVGIHAQKKTGVGILCRVPPPGGHGTFVSDVLCESYVVLCTEDDVFYEVPSEDCLKSHSATKKYTTISTRFVRALTQAVRFSHNPISAALGASYACASAASLRGTTKKQQGKLKGHAEKFSYMAKDLVDNIKEQSKLGVLLPSTQAQLAAVPQQRPDETAIELALTLEDREFTSHKDVEEHVEELWRGGSANLLSSIQVPGMNDLLDPTEMMKILGHNIAKLTDIDLIMSPVVRFFTAFFYLCGLVLLQHVVVLSDSTYASVDSFTGIEFVFIVVSFGFLMSEVEEVQAALSRRRITKYLSDGWNVVDWLLHCVFMAYFFYRWQGVRGYTVATSAAATIEARDALRILSFNCIFLWVRLMNVMTVSSELGPMIRMISLMAKQVAIFLVMLFMYIVGFAGTFHVWFQGVPDDGAADMDDLRVEIINTLGTAAQQTTEAAATELDSAGFDTLTKSMMTLFSAAMGDFSFDAIRKEQAFLGPILMMLYLFVGAVMLLNLLIAILSDVYAKVNDGAQKEVAFTKAKTVTTYRIYWDQQRTVIPLPPPLNLVTACVLPISWVVQGVVFLVQKSKSCCKEDKDSSDSGARSSFASTRSRSLSEADFRAILNEEKQKKDDKMDAAAASSLLHSTVNAGLLIAMLSTVIGCCVWTLATVAYAIMIPYLILTTIPQAKEKASDWATVISKSIVKSDGIMLLPVYCLAFFVCLPFSFAYGSVITSLAIVFLIVYMALALPFKMFSSGCGSMAEVCDEHHLNVPWLNKTLAYFVVDSAENTKAEDAEEEKEKGVQFTKIKKKYEDLGDHGAGRRRSPQATKWWLQFVEWKRLAASQRLAEAQMGTKDGKMTCKDPLSTQAILLAKTNEKSDERKTYMAALKVPKEENLPKPDSACTCVPNCACAPKCERDLRRVLDDIEGRKNSQVKFVQGGEDENALPVIDFIESFKVQLPCISVSDKKPSTRTYFLFEDFIMYMVFRYPHPPAVAVGEVCTLSNMDVAETSSGTLTKEAEEKQQREEFAQEVSNRMISHPGENATQVLYNTNSMKDQLDKLQGLMDVLIKDKAQASE